MRLSNKEKPEIVGLPEIFEGLHIKRSFLEEYTRNKINMRPAYRKEIEKHLLSVCDGKCQEVIDEIVRKEEKGDWKRSQLPDSDR